MSCRAALYCPSCTFRLSLCYFCGDGSQREQLLRSMALSRAPHLLLRIWAGRRFAAGVVFLAILLALPVRVPAQEALAPNPALDAAFQTLAKLQVGQNLNVLNPIELAVAQAHSSKALRADLEHRLLDILRGNATDVAKQYACRQLTLVGSEVSVPVLAKLLSSATLAHMARYAMEGIGGPAVKAALRAALQKTNGRQRLGIVISLGRLADADAVDSLARLYAAEDDRALRQAILVALGRIGTRNAAHVLLQAGATSSDSLKPVLVDARLEAAEHRREQHDYETARAIYQTLLAADSPRTKAAAFRGLILSSPSSIATMILDGLRASEPWKRAVAADCIYGLSDKKTIETIASAIPELPGAGQLAALTSLQQVSVPAVRTAALKALQADDMELRLAALRVLTNCALPADVPRIAVLAVSTGNSALREAVVKTLSFMPAPGTNQAIISLIAKDNQLAPVLLRCALIRRVPDAIPMFLRAAQSGNRATRLEAMKALEIMGSAEDIDALLKLLVKTAPGAEREAAGRALWQACQRGSDPSHGIALLLASLRHADTTTQAVLIPVLGRFGGKEILAVVHEAMQSKQSALRDAGYRALANWPDATVADELLDIAKTSPVASYRVWALRAFARVVSLPGAMPRDKAFRSLKTALALAKRLEDKKLIVTRLGAVRTVDSLHLLLTLLDNPELSPTVITAVFDVAKGLSRTHPKEAAAAFAKIRPLIKDPVLLQQMPRVLRDIKRKQKN